VCETLASLLLTFRELKKLTLSGSWTWTSRTETTTLPCGITSIRTLSSSHHVHEEGVCLPKCACACVRAHARARVRARVHVRIRVLESVRARVPCEARTYVRVC